MYLSSHNPSGFCQQASSCAGPRKQSISLCLKQYFSVTIFRYLRVDFSLFFLKRRLRVPHWVLTVCLIPYVSSVIITPGWFTLLSTRICLDAYCGELSNCMAPNGPCWLRHGWCLTFTPLCQEKGHCYELMTEQCSVMFDYLALYLCLPPPPTFSFPGHWNISFTLLPVVLQPRFCRVDSHIAKQRRYINRTLTRGYWFFILITYPEVMGQTFHCHPWNYSNIFHWIFID